MNYLLVNKIHLQCVLVLSIYLYVIYMYIYMNELVGVVIRMNLLELLHKQ